VHVKTDPTDTVRHVGTASWLWARVEAGTFDANITPAARGCRLPSTSSQSLLHTVHSAGHPWPAGDTSRRTPRSATSTTAVRPRR
jgi:hypothetical protein